MQIAMAQPLVSVGGILFPTDFSHASLAALPYAVAMAAKYDAKLFPAYIIPEPPGVPASMREGIEALHRHTDGDPGTAISTLVPWLGDVRHEILLRKGEV
jgi:hypothetical protein